MRGFVQGVVWGALAAVSGLVVLSQVAGPVTPRPDAIALTPPPPEPPPEPAQDEPVPPEPPEVAPPADTAPVAQADVPALATPPAPTESASSAVSVDPALPVAPPAPMAPPVSDPAATIVQRPEQPPAPPSSDPPADALASAGRIVPVVPPVVRAPPTAAMPPARLDTPAAEPAPRNPDLPPPPPPPPPAPAPQATAVPMPAPAPLAERSEPSFGPASGVVTGRLPRIGADDSSGPTRLDPTRLDPPPAADLPPRVRYARPFDTAAQLPLFAIVLIDTGAAEVNRAELAALDLPLSIVIDPLSDGAADRAAQWRAGGQEVLMAASGIPVGASPADLEQSLQVLSTNLPEAVALIDSDGTAFQNNSPLASQMVSILADQGRGLVSLDQGLNAAAREARRLALPATTIFRRLDAAEETAPVILRYLDRAAFQATQDGKVSVMGMLRPQTVDAILQWVGDGRASGVALAPITALLQP